MPADRAAAVVDHAPGDGAPPHHALTNHALREAAARLVAERRDLPPGSVLRCFSRAVRSTLLRGCPPAEVVAEAERLAAELLARRVVGEQRRRGGRRTGGPRVPLPRRA